MFSEKPHRRTRHMFEVLKSTIAGKNSDEVFKEIISKPILSERVIRTAKEIKNLDGQFWR